MRFHYIAGILVALLSSTAPAAAGVPILMATRADIGDIYVDAMHLEVGILGVYGARGLRPHVQIALTERLPCSDPELPCRASRAVSRTYDQIDGLIAALVEAQEHLSRKRPYRAELNLAEVRCKRNDDFQGTVVVDPVTMKVQFSIKSSNFISLNAEQAAGFLAQLNQAVGILAHLKPKFDAFNAAPVDSSIGVNMERAAYIQPLEEFVD